MKRPGVYGQLHQAVLDRDEESAIAICKEHPIDFHCIRSTFDRAAERGLLKVVTFFVENGCTHHLLTGTQQPGDTNSNVNWFSTLHWALGQHEVMEYLLENGAEPDEGMTYWTPLLDAIGDEEGCRLLKKYGAKETIFTHVARDDLAKVRRIVKEDAEAASTRDEFNHTPIFNAKSLEMGELLIEFGADVNACDNRKRSLLLTFFGGHYSGEHDEDAERALALETRILVKAGANVNARDHRRVTPLHGACLKANLPAIKELLRLGAEINAKDCEGKTPLFRVVNKPSEYAVTRYLLSKGADPTVKARKGVTPLKIAKGRNRKLLANALGVEQEDATLG